MKTLSIQASDNAIKNLIVEWAELLAKEKYTEAFNMFPHSAKENQWSPEELKKCILNYGSPEQLEDSPPCKVTSLRSRNDFDKIFNGSIDVDRENMFDLDPERYLGMVHFDDIPLDGDLSDLTARFHIMKINNDKLTLEFLDIHVM